MNRRSMMSQHSPALESPYAADHMEALDNDDAYDLPAQPSPIAGAQTVAYGPDQMLAVYAARGKVNSPSPSAPAASGPIPAPRPTAKRLLSNLTKRNEENTAPVPQSGEMRSFVHLHNGTASSAAVEALPAPGPLAGTGLKPPMTRARSNTVARQSSVSQGSTYSEDHVGSAQ
jgi:hypothetical protein